MDEMQEIMEDFLVEAFEMIEQIDQDLIELENNPTDLDLLNRIFRVAHTIKGSGSFLNFNLLTKLTHHMEDVLNKARHGELKIVPSVMDVVLEATDMMKSLLMIIREHGKDDHGNLDIEPIVLRLDAISRGDAPAVATKKENTVAEAKPVEAKVEESEEELDYSKMSPEEVEKEIDRLLQKKQEEDKQRRIKKQAEGLEVEEMPQAPEEKPAKAPEVKAEAKPAKAPEAKAVDTKKEKEDEKAKPPMNATEQTIRVDVKRLDHLMNLIGELVLGKNRLIKIYDDIEERYEGEKFLEDLNQVVSAISIVTTDLQIAVMKTRMLPVGKVFNKFPRMVRDIGRELGKDITLTISGEETELDKSIVEEIGDPLVHIIRNSADHGIESPNDRIAKGKPAEGTIILKAYNEGNHIVIEIRDDGKGIDAEQIKIKAIEKGLINEREADTMSDKEAYSIIFKAGFSMAKQVTNFSGRGVGMDVVKTNIEKLNGIIDIESEKGKGTILKLKIPLTLAIIQALLVRSQEETYAIPLASVLETVRINKNEMSTVDGKNVLRLRSDVLPLVRLADIFGTEVLLEDSEDMYIVVIGLAETKIGLIVDNLIGQEEIVIKSLGYYLKGTEGIAGATIRGDGKVTLIVDVGAIISMSKSIKKQVKKQVVATAAKAKNKASDYHILIVDDSTTDRNIIKASLKPLGVSTTEANNGVAGLDLIKSGTQAYDAILIDIEMPRMDGYTLASEIRKYSKFKNIPLIAVTSKTDKTDRMRGVEVGMTEYITKPYSSEYLANVVKRNINLNVGAE